MKQALLSILILFAFTVNAQKSLPDQKLLKKYNKAIAEFNRQNDSTTADFYFKRGGIRQDFLDNTKAITDYDKSLQMDPNNATAYYNRGLAKLDLILLDEAIADFTKSLEIDPNQSHAYNNRGLCYYGLKDYAKAIKEYDMAITLYPRNGFAHNNRGIAKIKLGLVNEGCEDLHKALELGDSKSDKAIKKYCPK